MEDPAARTPEDAALEQLAEGLRTPLLAGVDAVPHEQPWRGPSGRALAVARPEGIDEVRTIVRWARRHRIRLIPQGAVTGLVGASTPPPRGPRPLLVDTAGLAAPLEVHHGDAVAIAGAGVRLSALNEAAAPHGLELPVDLAADPALGAMVATNTGGTRVLARGDMSRQVLGIQAVIADEGASVIGNLRGLRKDNTGPDATRFLVGSAGAFGIITAVAVALAPVPQERATVLVGPLDDADAVDLLGVLRARLGNMLSAYEVMCPAAVSAALGRVRAPRPIEVGRDPEVLVLAEASGPRGCGDALVEAVAGGGTSSSGAPPGVALPPSDAWTLRHAITEGLRTRGEVIGFDLSVAPSMLPALRRAVRDLVEEVDPQLTVADFGHWGDGGIHANVVVPSGHTPEPSVAEDLRHRVYDLVTRRFGGSWSAEHGVGPLNAAQWELATPPGEVAILRSIKDLVDPARVLGHPGLPFG